MQTPVLTLPERRGEGRGTGSLDALENDIVGVWIQCWAAFAVVPPLFRGGGVSFPLHDT